MSFSLNVRLFTPAGEYVMGDSLGAATSADLEMSAHNPTPPTTADFVKLTGEHFYCVMIYCGTKPVGRSVGRQPVEESHLFGLYFLEFSVLFFLASLYLIGERKTGSVC